MTAPTLPDSAYALSFDGPDAHEQLMVELINRARQDPLSEVSLSGDSIASGISTTPVEVLAVAPELDAAAQGHSDDMLLQGFFSHTNPNTGKDPFDRMRDEGYSYRSAGENISWISLNSYSADMIVRHHENLWASDGHQANILNASFSEIGIGYSSGSGGNYLTQKFGDRGLTYLTGVVIDDTDGDSFYDVGEGQGAVRITAWNDAGSFATSTWDAGGYSLLLEAGTYTVRFEGGDLDGVYETQVVIGNQNVKLDVIEGLDTTEPATPDTSADQGGSGDDIFEGTAGADIYDGKGGDDQLTGLAGDDQFWGSKGKDTLDMGEGTDSAYGGRHGDVIYGRSGADTLSGGRGKDTIFGGTGADQISGGKGADSIKGGQGDDVISTGAGADTIIWASGDGDDVVTGFNAGKDKLQFEDLTVFADLSARSTIAEDGLLIDLGDGSILLEGISDAGQVEFEFV